MRIEVLFIAISFLQPFGARAQSDDPAGIVVTSQQEVRRTEPTRIFTVGLQSGYFDYAEPGMSDRGMMNGVQGSLTFRRGDRNLLFRLEGELLYGRLTYDGALMYQDGRREPVRSDTTDVIWTVKGLAGYPLQLNLNWEMTPFLGLATRALNDRNEGIGSYEREVQYIYFPVGAELNRRLGAKSFMSLKAEYDLFFGGTVRSHMTDAGADHDLVNSQTDGYGYRVAWAFGSALQKFGWRTEAYYQLWHIKDSQPSYLDAEWGYMHEPENRTRQVGLNLLLEM